MVVAKTLTLCEFQEMTQDEGALAAMSSEMAYRRQLLENDEALSLCSTDALQTTLLVQKFNRFSNADANIIFFGACGDRDGC